MSTQGTALSAVIATKDRPGLLGDCLRTLADQEIAPGTLEVLVVDDGSSIDLSQVVEAHDGERAAMRLVRQEPGGANAARNHGASQARGHIVAYLDDDTLVSPNWAAAVMNVFEETGCDGMGGRIELQLEGHAPKWLDHGDLRNFLSEFELGGERKELKAGHLPVSANAAVTKDAFERVGGFNVKLGRQEGSLLSNDETEFFGSILQSGGRLFYEPGAHVLHRVSAERLTIEWFRRRTYAQGVSDVIMDSQRMTGSDGLGREFVRLGRVLPIFGRGILGGRGATNAVLWSSYCRGRFDAIRGRVQARSLRSGG